MSDGVRDEISLLFVPSPPLIRQCSQLTDEKIHVPGCMCSGGSFVAHGVISCSVLVWFIHVHIQSVTTENSGAMVALQRTDE